MTKQFIWLAIFACLGCKTRNTRSGVLEYTSPQQSELILDSVESYRGDRISYQASYVEYFVPNQVNTQEGHRKWTITFPSLTLQQFEHLNNFYSQGRSHVKYITGNTYDLVDFLPPNIQASMRLPESYLDAIPEEQSPNCWTTAFEYTRQMLKPTAEFTMFFVMPEDMMEFYDKNTVKIDGVSLPLTEHTMGLIKPSDLLLMYEHYSNGSRELVHAAVYIDRNLVIDKAGISASPYRIAKIDDRYLDRKFYTLKNFPMDFAFVRPKNLQNWIKPEDALPYYERIYPDGGSAPQGYPYVDHDGNRFAKKKIAMPVIKPVMFFDQLGRAHFRVN